MTQTPEELAAPVVAELKSEAVFDLRSALNKTSYPTEDVTIYLDGDATHERNVVLDTIAELTIKSESLSAHANGGIADDPEKETVDAMIANLEARAAELLEQVKSSSLTFKMRGLAPVVWRLLDKEARRKIKPLTKSDDDELEAQIERNEYVNIGLVAKGAVSITNAAGATDSGVLKHESAQHLYDTILESEWNKLKGAIDNLTFAHTIFQNVAMQDADFLSKSSADQGKPDTSE